MNHTYMNTVPRHQNGPAEVVDMDMDFVTDANVYYNLPPLLPSGNCRGTSLPRGHHSPQHQQMNRASSSCPASPKLPSAASSPRKGGLPLPRPPSASDKGSKPSSLPPAVPERGDPKPKHEKLSHTRSFDLDHIYQNLCTAVKGASKPRSNSFSIPWRRKKKPQEASPGIVEETREEGGGGGGGGSDTPQPLASPSVTSSTSHGHENGSPRSVSDTRGSRTSLNSSSENSSDSSNEDNDAGDSDYDDYWAEVCPGVTYIRSDLSVPRFPAADASAEQDEEQTSYNTTATLPLRGAKGPKKDTEDKQQDANLELKASIEEWRQKARWLERKRRWKDVRVTGESHGIDIAILYASDGTIWKNYLHTTFTRCLKGDRGFSGIWIEAVNVEEIEDDIELLQRMTLKSAKLQIVILSPHFMEHIANHARSELGHVFKPKKVLCLLLNVDKSSFTSAHLSVLYSYKEWQHLTVRSEDMSFVKEVLNEATTILNSSEVYSGYRDERLARFKVIPRKITLTQPQVFIIMTDAVKEDVEISVSSTAKEPTIIKKWHLQNPYTISFQMPESFLKTSAFLYIVVSMNGQNLGSRQVKCERNMDTLSLILANSKNPIDLMCQALNLNPMNNDLDQCLAKNFSMRIPPSRCKDDDNEKGTSIFPTWIHFSAYYGLKMFTWALLEAPGGRCALSIPNCDGDTPSLLAFKNGYLTLAQGLETEMMYSKSREVSLPQHIKKTGSRKARDAMYNNPPPPRPLRSNYDTVPAPRLVSPSNSPPAPSEESKDLYTVVTKSLTEKIQNKNSESPNEFDSSKATVNVSSQEQVTTGTSDQRSDDTVSENESGATYMTASNIPDTTNRSTTNLVRHFVGLLGGRRRPLHMEGTRSLRDEPNYYIDDPTLNTQAGRTRCHKESASDTDEEKQCPSPMANGQTDARSHEPSPGPASGTFLSAIEINLPGTSRVSLRDGAENGVLKERPPVPAPFPVYSDDEEDNYLDPSRLNTPPRYQILLEQQCTSKCKANQYYKFDADESPRRIRLRILKPKREEEEDCYEDLNTMK
ncbi:uncharacterized protein LOC122259240 isoform X3 [Penaeus japonicus]|uniref:uncharacterized protein LOC122259240 isoform X3 n=1 Tax=Penaeus japonicus TaxID=27405 RepID=UPI001C70D24C|nr:uncharacterized protein LOC122259240 isoform X3 [Penaeus japonicus]